MRKCLANRSSLVGLGYLKKKKSSISHWSRTLAKGSFPTPSRHRDHAHTSGDHRYGSLRSKTLLAWLTVVILISRMVSIGGSFLYSWVRSEFTLDLPGTAATLWRGSCEAISLVVCLDQMRFIFSARAECLLSFRRTLRRDDDRVMIKESGKGVLIRYFHD